MPKPTKVSYQILNNSLNRSMNVPMPLLVVKKEHKNANVKMPPNTALHVTKHANHQKLRLKLIKLVVNVLESMPELNLKIINATYVQPITILKINAPQNA
jgi:hypothetical protein